MTAPTDPPPALRRTGGRPAPASLVGGLAKVVARALRSVVRLFFSPLTLDRRQGKLRVALQVDPQEVLEPQAPQPLSAEAELLVRMRGELKTLLSQRPDTRRVLRHLAVLETQLQREGLDAIERLPPEVLGRATEQLESLREHFDTPGLVALHSRLRLALIQREEAVPPESRSNDFLSDFGVGQRVIVNEDTPSNFDAWRNTLPVGDAAPGASRQAGSGSRD
ncbi:hypothetical protein HNQ51_002355 [Inhella inkyongensis]|uniref:Uncharacterized protein n=1 Tax=Inhella inkyongensis TaxID=392593 RepID=A0A840S7P7_9BURK|nr:hypothetical protein [Inhella inkyongensis]MBB5205036.1 hypothetical protein [Inhella inkyongensis]